MPDLKSAPALEDPEQARFRLFDSITTFLKTAGQNKPLVLILDDLHWADKPSLMMLEFVARELSGARLLLVGTYRDVELSRRHPLAQTLGELTRQRLFQRVILRGLAQEDVDRFIEVTSGLTPPPGLVAAVYAQTEGNPLFVTEVVRLLVQEGELTTEAARNRESLRPGSGQAWTVRIPEGVREVIGRRLDRLSERCNETLTVASVIGREFDMGVLVRLVEGPSAMPGERMSEDRMLEVLEEALAAQVIKELPQALGRYEFTHALIHETLAEELSLTRRVRLHARIAETLEELYGADADARAVELAHYYSQAEAVLGSEKLVHYSLLAGERALATYAREEALAHFERALAAKLGRTDTVHPEPVEGRAADAQTVALPRERLPEAVENLKRAFDFYEHAGEKQKAIAVAQTFIAGDFSLPGLKELLQRGLELAAPESGDAAILLARYGRYVGQDEGDFEAARKALDQAFQIVRREQDPRLEMPVRTNANTFYIFNRHWEEALRGAQRVVELCPGPGRAPARGAWACTRLHGHDFHGRPRGRGQSGPGPGGPRREAPGS